MKTRLISAVFGAFCGIVVSSSAQTNYLMLDGHPVHPTRILAKYKSGVSATSGGEGLSRAGSRVQRFYPRAPGLVVLEESGAPADRAQAATEEVSRQQLVSRMEALRQTGDFEYVEPDYMVKTDLEPTDTAYVNGSLWGLNNYGQNGGIPGADIGATNAWELTTGSTNVIVAVIDTGIRYTHESLQAQMWRNPGEIPGNNIDDDGNGYVDDVYGINAILDTGNPFDDGDHGTHVAGTIGASANDDYAHVGVAWNVRLMACKFLGATGGGFTSDAIECIDYAVAMGARILNNSWGGGGASSALQESIERARVAGVLFVAAAGNDGLDNDLFPHYPSSFGLDNIISVAALDRRDNVADFSNFGATSVDLGAPGVAIFSSISESNNSYSVFDGTSMATPHVSGVAALILSRFPAADLDELIARINLGVVPVPALNGVSTTGGRVNAYNSLVLSGQGILQATLNPPNNASLLTGSDQVITVKVTDPPFSEPDATVTASITGLVDLELLDDGAAPDVLAGDSIYTAQFQVPNETNDLTMLLEVSAEGKVGVTNTITYFVLPPPPNDYFTNAIKVASGGAVYRSNNRFGTLEGGEPIHAGVTGQAASLWWVWTASTDTNVFLDTTGSSIDTVLAVYTGNQVTSLTELTSVNDIGPNRQARLSFDAEAGVAYRIAVSSASTNSLGSLRFGLTPGGEPDTRRPLVYVNSPLSGTTFTNDNIELTGEAFDPPPHSTGVAEVLMRVNGGITRSAAGTTNWTAFTMLQPGLNTIEFRSVDLAGNFSLPLIVQANYFPNDPINDIFQNAIALDGDSGSSTVDTTRATKEVGEPAHAGNQGGKSVWWTYQPTSDGVLALSTSNSTFDTLMGVYQGPVVAGLTTLAGNDDAEGGLGVHSDISLAVRSNQTYRIAVDGYDGVSGDAVLSFQFSPDAVYLLATSNTLGGQVTPPTGYYAESAEVVVTAIPDPSYTFSGWQGSVTTSENPLIVTITNDMTLTGVFTLQAFTDGFESGGLTSLNWMSAGDAPWLVQSNVVRVGAFAARSGNITNNQTSSLILSNDFEVGFVFFDYKVSSELNYDFLRFYLDGALVQEWSGEVDWSTFAVPVTEGFHQLEWRYVKDPSLSSNLDAAFLDNIALPFAVPVNDSSVAWLDITRQPDQTVMVEVVGQPNQRYVIQRRSISGGWQSVSTNVAINGLIHFTDPVQPSGALQIYRAVVP